VQTPLSQLLFIIALNSARSDIADRAACDRPKNPQRPAAPGGCRTAVSANHGAWKTDKKKAGPKTSPWKVFGRGCLKGASYLDENRDFGK
jgi:hypothetical protein